MGAVCSCCGRPGVSAKAKRQAAAKTSSRRAAEDLRRMAAMRPTRTKKKPEPTSSLASIAAETSGVSSGENESRRTKLEKLSNGQTETEVNSTAVSPPPPPPPTSIVAVAQQQSSAHSNNSSPIPVTTVTARVMSSGGAERGSSSSLKSLSNSVRRSLRRSPCSSLSHSPQEKSDILNEGNTLSENAEDERFSLTDLEQFACEFKKMPSKKQPEPATNMDSDGHMTILHNESDELSDRSLGKLTPMYGPGQVVEAHLVDSATFGDIELGLSARGSSSNSMILVEVRSAGSLVYRSAPYERPNIYMKIYLQNDDGSKVLKRKTKNRPGRDNVQFDEILMFRCAGVNKIMKVMVWEDHGVLGRNVMQGEVLIDLAVVDLRMGVAGWYPLFPPYSSSAGNLSPAASLMSLSSAVSNDTTCSARSPKKLIPSGSQQSLKKKGEGKKGSKLALR